MQESCTFYQRCKKAYHRKLHLLLYPTLFALLFLFLAFLLENIFPISVMKNLILLLITTRLLEKLLYSYKTC